MNKKKWFPFIQNHSEAKFRLICLPHSGGVASLYQHLNTYLPAQIELCSVQLPGRETRYGENFVLSIDTLTDQLSEACQELIDRPFALFGHSLGALIGFELLKKLRTHSLSPHMFFISACNPPHKLVGLSTIHQLSDEDFMKKVRSWGDAIPKKVLENPELMNIILPRLRADFTLFETYPYKEEPALTCPFTLFGGTEDPIVTPSNLQEWAQHTTCKPSLRIFSGDHFYHQQFTKELCDAISKTLLEESV